MVINDFDLLWPGYWAGAVMVFVGVLLIPVVIGLPILLLGLLLALDGLG